MTGWEIVALAAVLALALVAAVFGAAEAVFTRLSRARAEALFHDSDTMDSASNESAALRGGGQSSRSRVVLSLIAERVPTLAGAWFVTMIALLGMATIVSVVAFQRGGGIAVVVAFAVHAAIVYPLVVLGPRTAALTRLDSTALRVAPLLRQVATPLAVMIRPLLKFAGRRADPTDDSFVATPVSEAELLAMTGQAAEDDAIDPEELQMIASVIEFGDTRVSTVLVPRPDMVTVSGADSVAEGLQLVVDYGFSRFPVVGDGIDDILGVAHAKDLVAAQLRGDGDLEVAHCMRQPRFVPETKLIARLQREMQAETFHLAIVIDEYGGTAGLVTMEDLLEELVGEIVDEFDVEEPMIERLNEGARVNGKVSLSDVEGLLGERLPEGDWSTVGGLIFSTLGHVPHEGEEIELDNHRLVVERVQGRRIARVRLSRLPEALEPVDQ